MLDARFCNTPLAIEPGAAARLLSAGRVDAYFGDGPDDSYEGAGYDVVGGVALIAIQGVLLPRLGCRRPWGRYATGYDGVAANLADALADAKVRAIALDINSPGGAVDGLFDLVDAIYAARELKPIVAIVADHAYSAGYALASAASFVTVPRTGGTGSIGVITALTDYSAALEKAGMAVHFITFGEKKAAEMRAELTGVTADVLAAVQADVDTLGELFVATVARNRAIEADAVRGQEARCFLGYRGVSAGLADRVLSPPEAFAALLADLGAA